MDSSFDVTVVIPCYNGAATLGRQLEALSNQECEPSFEVIVSDNGSTDDPGAVVERFDSRFKIVDASTRRGINHARNCGRKAGAGRLFLFCDADDVVHGGWLQAHFDAFAAGADLTGGSLCRVTPSGQIISWQRHLNDWLFFRPWPTGANCGAARQVFDTCGDFDESLLGGGDETEFFWRAQSAGFELTFVPDAAIDYVARDTGSAVFAQNVGFGRSHVRLYEMFGSDGMRRPRRRDVAKPALIAALRAVRHPREPDRRRLVMALAGQLRGRTLQYRERRTPSPNSDRRTRI